MHLWCTPCAQGCSIKFWRLCTRTIRLVPYETHVAMSSVMPMTNANVKGKRWDDETHVLMGQGHLKSAILDTSFVPCILNEKRKATLSICQCLLNLCLMIFKLLLIYTRPKSSYMARQVQNKCFPHLFRYWQRNIRLYVHVILLFRSLWEFRPYAQRPCRTHMLGPRAHGYGLANFTLLTHS